MRKLILSIVAASAALAAAGSANAQSATVLTVDTDRILAECTACRTAATQIQSQVTSARQRAQALEGQLRTEAQGLETQVKALNGRQPEREMAKP